MSLTDAARAAGIASGYHDLWGAWRETPQSTMVAALDALGYAGAPQSGVLEHSVAARSDAEALQPLPTLLVVRAGEVARIPVQRDRVQAALESTGAAAVWAQTSDPLNLRWQLLLEDGSRAEGSLACTDAQVELVLPVLAVGYHRLRLRLDALSGSADDRSGDVRAVYAAPPLAEGWVLVAPERCHLPPALAAGAREWGIAVQLYGVRSGRNWGIGDFTDLHALIDSAAALGARVLGLNPLHALPLDRPENASPYSAVSRLFLHPLYIDPERVQGLVRPEAVHEVCAGIAGESVLSGLRACERVDYPAVARIKLAALRRLYEAFRGGQATLQAQEAFGRFQATTQGLRAHATWQSIQCTLHAEDPSVWGWPSWPELLRDPRSPEVMCWQAEHADDVAFHEFLEWQARLQWQNVRDRARAAGVALYGDLALGADRGGSEVWSAQADHALSINAGCPPDDFNLKGQDWGLPPVRPDRLAASGCAAFRAAIRAAMAQFDALRLDHVMSLMRLFWIPSGASAAEGAYVDYPFDAMLATLKIESVRSGCMAIGEDLGTVQPEVRTGLQSADVLSYRLLVFERDSATHFKRPEHYPRLALATIGSHDLSPLQGWWTGDDLALRGRLGLLDAQQIERFSWDRGEARRGLLSTLEELGLLPAGESNDPARYPLLPASVVDAVHAMLARSQAMWVMVNPEDVFDLIEATNLPGTTREHPNWQRRVPVPIEAWADHPRLRAVAGRMTGERG